MLHSLVSVRRDSDWLRRQNLQACIFEYGLVGCFAISFYDLVCSMFENALIADNNAAQYAEPRCASTHGGSMQLDWKYKSFPMPMDGGTSRISAYSLAQHEAIILTHPPLTATFLLRGASKQHNVVRYRLRAVSSP